MLEYANVMEIPTCALLNIPACGYRSLLYPRLFLRLEKHMESLDSCIIEFMLEADLYRGEMERRRERRIWGSQ